MRNHLFFLLLLLILAARPAAAQVVIYGGSLFNMDQGSVKVKVLEEGSENPVSYASAYLTAKGDTLITNFTLTDSTGVANITKVTRGTYNLTVEMLGYKTYRKEHYVSFSWDKQTVDLGTIHLAQDTEMLDAAKVTAIGNPIEVRQDTVIFNASSFIIGQNQMLEDLLKRMPGMEVSSDGTVKYNGETIQKITVGGKTFFFDDPKMALKNLPAKVVDKVKVIDKVSDSEQFTGVATDREKVMDLEFKQEFKDGWFGNLGGGLGTTLAGDRKEEMVDDRGLLYTANAMVSGYNEKDQITVVGNGSNAPITDDGGVIVAFGIVGEMPADVGGIKTNRQLGVNYNTERIKKMQTSAMASYNYNFGDSRSQSQRQTFVTDGSDILSDASTKRFASNDAFKLGLELKNTSRKKFLFNFEPQFNYTLGKTESYNDNDARQRDDGLQLNRSSSSTYLESRQFNHSARLSAGIRKLGNDRRSLTFNANWSVSDYDADSREFSRTELRAAADPVIKDLFYGTDNRNYTGRAGISYIEPLAKLWVLSVDVNGFASVRDNNKNAFNRTSGEAGFDASVLDKGNYRERNDYYSTAMRNDYYYLQEIVQFQYKKERTSVQLGFQLQESLNETRSRSLGRDTQTGIGEWLLDWSPYVNLRFGKAQRELGIFYTGRSSQPSNSNLIPVLDISVPTRQQLGNIYLQPSFRQNLNLNLSLNNPQAQWNCMLYGGLDITSRQTVTASWFDSDGIQYSIPVNSAKPSLSTNVFTTAGVPLSADKKFRASLNVSAIATRSVSYQNTRRLEGLDADSFDYTSFMEQFWGDSDGRNFYEGRSGFSESLTHSFNLSPSLSFSYRGEHLSAGLSGGTGYRSTHYSLDSAADTRTWASNIGGHFTWTTPHEWELNSNAHYCFYNGYPDGFYTPYLSWNANVTKNIKAWAIGLHFNDILNSVRSTSHTVTANYIEDSMRNQLGRHIYVSVRWNFGKLNAAKSGNARRAALRMQGAF